MPLFGMGPEDSASYFTDTCSAIFIAVLFTTARKWKEPKRPSAGEWIKKVQYMYTVEFHKVKS